MTRDTATPLLSVAGMCAGAALTIQICLLGDVSAGGLIRSYLRTRDRKRAVRLWAGDKLTHHCRPIPEATPADACA